MIIEAYTTQIFSMFEIQKTNFYRQQPKDFRFSDNSYTTAAHL